MKNFLSVVGVVVILAATCVSCDKIKPPQPELQTPSAASGQASQQEDEGKAFTQAAQKELDELGNVIAGFRAKAEAGNLQTKARLDNEVGKLEAGLGETQQRMIELKSATVESGNRLKKSLGNSLEKLKNEIDNFRKKDAV